VEPVERADGTRIYVGRLYPRGVKDNTLWDERIHDLGPSAPLHKAVIEGKISFDEFGKRYMQELSGPPGRTLVLELAGRSRAGETMTLLCDHPRKMPADRCHRFLLKVAIDEAS
jgi:uncharacterized protein YeaO (DUF488 family)